MVRIRAEILAAMRAEAAKTSAQECCGVLAGRDGIITHIFPAPNALASATAYEIAPQELFRVMKDIRAAKLHMMGIYHSHPAGENRPSRSDVERAFYPETPYSILSSLPGAPQPVRAFLICDGAITELKVEAV
ncbi:MAG: M67 family metallopeptidase [Candidatus Acidiferrales bacterium]